MGRILLSLVAVFIIVGGIIVYQATRGTSSLVLLPSDLIKRGEAEELTRIRVGGRVVEPISYQVEPSFELKFLVQDPKNPTGTVPVVYRGIKPDMFTAGRDVIIDGDYDHGTIKASKLLTQCPSKYEPPSAPGQKPSEPESQGKGA